MNKEEIILVINKIRQEFTKSATGAEGMKLEEAIHKTYPFATDWLDPDEEARQQG